LSARTPAALAEAGLRVAEHLRANPDLPLADVAYTLQAGRRAFGHRRAVVCTDVDDAVRKLAIGGTDRATAPAEPTEVAFVFPGQGSQYAGMTSGLYKEEPVFRAEVDRSARHLRAYLGIDLREVLYAPPDDAQGSRAIDATWLAQPALFATEYAMAQLLLSWGIRPLAMIGHSVGEYVSACLAGVFSLEDALALVATRGRLMQACAPGSMLWVGLSEDRLRRVIGSDLDLAATNSPSLSVVSGSIDAIDELARRLEADGISTGRIHTSHAFHSAMIDPAVAPFTEFVESIPLRPPARRFVSNVTGTWITPGQATSGGYWARHMRNTVRFQESVSTLLSELSARCVLLEVGPGRNLTTLIRHHPSIGPGHLALSAGRATHDRASDRERLLASVARMWKAGVRVDWDGLHAPCRPQRVPLPGYPFEAHRHWVDADNRTPERLSPGSGQREITDWFSLQSWKRSVVSAPAAPPRRRWLVFEDSRGIGAAVTAHLRARGDDVTVVRAGRHFQRGPDSRYVVRPAQAEDYQAVLKSLAARGGLPERVVHLWSVEERRRRSSPEAAFARAQDRGLYSLLRIAQGFIRHGDGSTREITVVTDGVQRVTGHERMRPDAATVLGACRTIPQEYPNLLCRSVDVSLTSAAGEKPEEIAADIAAEISCDIAQVVVAYRLGQRWIQSFEPAHLKGAPARPSLLRDGGVYLITGGLGNIGLAIAEQIAREARVTLILLSRTPLPRRDTWPLWVATHDGDEAVGRRIRAVEAIEALGSDVLTLSVDITDAAQVRRALASVDGRCRTIDGIVHAAGTISPSGFFGIDDATPERCAVQFRPKIAGLVALEHALRGQRPDFWVLVSSLASVLGGLGYVGYASANAFLDAYGLAAGTARRPAWITINWDSWNFSGSDDCLAGMTPPEGVETFRRVLAHPSVGQVLVSVTDLATRLRDWVDPASMRERVSLDLDVSSAHPRPAMQTTYVAPTTDMERAIAEILQGGLGIDLVGIHDNFFEDLGGHSLLATQVVARIRAARLGNLTLRQFLDMPTVAELAAFIADGADDHPDRTGERAPESVLAHPPGRPV
jgi:acyl transferase domain-containing protein